MIFHIAMNLQHVDETMMKNWINDIFRLILFIFEHPGLLYINYYSVVENMIITYRCISCGLQEYRHLSGQLMWNCPSWKFLSSDNFFSSLFSLCALCMPRTIARGISVTCCSFLIVTLIQWFTPHLSTVVIIEIF